MEKNKNQFCSIMPVDAAGNTVSLDTEYMYDFSGAKHRVMAFQFLPSIKKWRVEVDDYSFAINIEDLCLTQDCVYEKLKDEIYHLVMSEYLDDPEGDVDRIVDRIKDIVDSHQD